MRYRLPLLASLCLLPFFVGCDKEPSAPPQAQKEKKPVYALPATPKLSTAGYKLILDYEVGGGRSYYERFLARPTVPPEQSGLTIGVGYDTRFYSRQVIMQDWRKLPTPQPSRLAEGSGKKRPEVLDILARVKDILIKWDHAEGVFNEVTIPQYYSLAKSAYPGMEALHADAQAVLVSLVYNRGAGMVGGTRAEMRNIKPLAARADYRGMAREIRAMKRLWPNTKGLLRRRDAEADLMEACARPP